MYNLNFKILLFVFYNLECTVVYKSTECTLMYTKTVYSCVQQYIMYSCVYQNSAQWADPYKPEEQLQNIP